MFSSDMTGTYDIAVFDVDNDGFSDIVTGRCVGTFVWMNEATPGVGSPQGTTRIGGSVTIRR